MVADMPINEKEYNGNLCCDKLKNEPLRRKAKEL